MKNFNYSFKSINARFIISFFAIVILALGTTLAYSEAGLKSKVESKIKDIKAQVLKIVVSTPNGDVTFSGDEAKYVFDKIKTPVAKNVRFYVKKLQDTIDDIDMNEIEKEIANGKRKALKLKIECDSGEVCDINDFEDFKVKIPKIHIPKINITVPKIEFDGYFKNIKITTEDGKKKVIISEFRDGKHIEREYIGKDAEEYIKKNNIDDENQSHEKKLSKKKSTK